MKKQTLRISLMLGLLAILAVSSAHAQSSYERTTNIPFSFTVGDKTFPAGEYRVMRLNPQSSQAALAIKSIDGQMSKTTLTAMDLQRTGMTGKAKLVFNRYGDQYFLSEVWLRANDGGHALPMSRSEREIANHSGDEKPQRQTIALNSRRQ